MKATDLNQAFNDVDCAYLLEVDAPEKENSIFSWQQHSSA